MDRARVRADLRAQRGRWALTERDAASVALTERVVGTGWWASASCVAGFVGTAEEISTRALLEAAWSGGKRVVLPRVASPVAALAWHLVSSERDLVRGRWGLWEPDMGLPGVTLADVDVIFVPGVAFDRWGGRLGMGGGYYDRALAPWRDEASPLRVGLCGAPFLLASRLDQETFDVPVHAVVTEREIADARGAL